MEQPFLVMHTNAFLVFTKILLVLYRMRCIFINDVAVGLAQFSPAR